MNNESIQIIHEYEKWLVVKGYKPRGIEEKIRAVRDYINYSLTADIDIYHVTLREAEGYRENLRLFTDDKGRAYYNPKTINARIAYLRLFYRYLLGLGQIMNNPFNDIERMKEKKSLPKNILSVEQMKKLLEEVRVKNRDDVKFKVLIELLYASGMRISEVEKIEAKDINTERGYIDIHDDKARQDRRVPLTEYSNSLLKLYMKYLPGNGPVFKHGKNRTLNRWVNDRLKRLTRALDLPLLSCHSIRHSIATHLLKSGADLREVQEILGHRKIANTELYTRIFPEDLKAVVENTHPREKGSSYEKT